MELKIGELYKNRTLSFLVPALAFYGQSFKDKFSTVFKIAFGVFDKVLEGSHLEGQKNLFILIDKEVQKDQYASFMSWVKNQDYYVTDYCYDVPETGRLQMLVIAFPSPLENVYEKFLKGKYSEMYVKKEVEEYFSELRKAETRGILLRTTPSREKFITQVREVWGTELTFEDFKKEKYEYDFPPKEKEEIFNQYLKGV
jgi:hypothetical protein